MRAWIGTMRIQLSGAVGNGTSATAPRSGRVHEREAAIRPLDVVLATPVDQPVQPDDGEAQEIGDDLWAELQEPTGGGGATSETRRGEDRHTADDEHHPDDLAPR